MKIMASDPQAGQTRIDTALLAAIGAARESVHLTTAYLAPGPDMLAALQAAARRGVKVAMVLPGQSDFKLVLHAGRSYDTDLLAAGVAIHELPHAVLHAKTAVIDGVFATVGFSHMDCRSIVDIKELNAIVVGAEFRSEMAAMFARDRALSPSIGRAAERWL